MEFRIRPQPDGFLTVTPSLNSMPRSPITDDHFLLLSTLTPSQSGSPCGCEFGQNWLVRLDTATGQVDPPMFGRGERVDHRVDAHSMMVLSTSVVPEAERAAAMSRAQQPRHRRQSAMQSPQPTELGLNLPGSAGTRFARLPCRNLRTRRLHTLCIGSNPCRPPGTHVYVGFGQSGIERLMRLRRFIERWPFRAVTGTITQQRRDDEAGCPGLQHSGGQRSQASRAGDSEE